jgi:ribosomal protein L11 methyltransferase
VLSVAAARLGAASVLAVDIDPHARAATSSNVAGADLAGVVAVSDVPVDEVAGGFDVVVANILPGVLVELASRLWPRVAPGGALVLSGIPDDRVAVVLGAFPVAGPVATYEEGGWTAIVLRTPGA